MPGRNANIGLAITGEADLSDAKRDAKRDLDVIADAGDDAAEEIEQAFRNLSPKLDTRQIRQALELADQLDGLTASLTVDADISELQDAERLARDLRAFQAKIDLDVEGKAELAEALNLSEQFERIRKVRLEVEGEQSLQRAAQLADDIERRRTVPIDAQASDLVRLDSDVGDALTAGGEAGAEGIAGSLADIDYQDIGAAGLDKLTGALAAAGPWAAVGGAVSAIFGDEFIEGFNAALPSARADTARALRTNLAAAELEEVGTAAGDAWAGGFGESLPQLKDDAAALQQAFGAVGDDLDLSKVNRQAQALSEVFGIEVPDQIRIVQQLVKNGLVPDAVSGFNLIAREAQTLGGATEDAFDVISEFSPVFKKLGIDGAQAADIIAQEWEEGLVTQIDRAGEQFEEFNIRITDGSARDAVQALSLDFDDMQQRLARGQGRDVLAQIAGELAAMPDKAHAADLGIQIFGASIESASDPQRVFELLATADAIGDVGTTAEDMADQLEESSSGLERLKRVATDLGEELGGTVADGLDTLNSLANLEFGDAADSAASFGDVLAVKLLGPLGELADKAGLDPLGPLKDGFAELSGKADELPPKLASTIDKLDETGEAAEGTGLSMKDAAEAADELVDNIKGLFDFSADQLLREVAEAADDLADSFAEGGAEAVGMGGSIDIGTEAGRKLQEKMEDVNGVLVDLAVALANNEITSEQYAAATDELTGALNATGAEAGVTKDKVEGLRLKYLDVEGIGSINTDFTVNTQRAIDNVTALSRAIAGINSKSVTISASVSGPVGITGTISRKARGGWTEGLTLVGEEGPELVEFQGRAFVHTAAETRGLLANDRPAAPPTPAPGGRSFIENATIVVDRGVDLWQQALLAEQVFRAL